jgi:hypothetical protein
MRQCPSLILASLLLNLSACDSAEAQGEQAQLVELVNEDLDLEGMACTWDSDHVGPNERSYRLCSGGEGVQFCDSELWSECEMSEGCTAGEVAEVAYSDELCGDMRWTCGDFEGVTKWYVPLCNTPLVLNFGDEPVAFSAYTGDDSVEAFSVGGMECTTSDWPSATTPWLALDRDGNGRIEGGDELFGSGTRLASGRHAEQGFEALGELDENHDGRVDASDARFSELLVWADHNQDRRSQAAELSKLADADVQSLSVDYRSEVQCDERGNCGRERAAFEFAAGATTRAGEIVDVYLPCR